MITYMNCFICKVDIPDYLINKICVKCIRDPAITISYSNVKKKI